jgi:hypothetical protein
MMRVFEKAADGLLIEVAPSAADERREGRRVSRLSLEIDVLWTADEEAARDAEEAAEVTKRSRHAEAAAAAEKRRIAAIAKLEALGISADELRDALS